jgi:SAM-dependent methyltransferase
MGWLRSFADANVRASRRVDWLLPARLSEDGNKYFIRAIRPSALREHAVVYDMGGGSCPAISLEEKQSHTLTVVGLDISADELAAAPDGIYDRTIAADLCTFLGDGDADAVICQSTLEHVPDGVGSMRALATTVRPGGRVFLFAPSRNAVFARCNLLLPEAVKRRLLFAFFPKKANGHDGFRAYYDHCTPRDIESLARANGLEVEERHLFWTSSYFSVLTPAFVVWRLWQLVAYLFLRENAAETFAYVLYRPTGAVGERGQTAERITSRTRS